MKKKSKKEKEHLQQEGTKKKVKNETFAPREKENWEKKGGKKKQAGKRNDKKQRGGNSAHILSQEKRKRVR